MALATPFLLSHCQAGDINRGEGEGKKEAIKNFRGARIHKYLILNQHLFHVCYLSKLTIVLLQDLFVEEFGLCEKKDFLQCQI